MAIDISRLPPPPGTEGTDVAVQPDISRLPAPVKDSSRLPPPPTAGAGTDISRLPSPEQVSGTTPSSVDKEIADRSFFDKPGLGAEDTKDSEIVEIARKHGVSPEELRELAPYFGARLEGADPLGKDELVKRPLGALGQVALGIPQKLYKSLQDPAMEKALDDLQALAQGRQSWLQFGAEVAAPVGPAVKGATSVARAALTGAGVGAVAGVAGSRQGDELQAGATGAVLGGALGAVVQKVVSRSKAALGPTESRLLADSGEGGAEQAPRVERAVDEILETRKASEADIEAVLSGGLDVDDQVADRWIREQVSPEDVRVYLNRKTPEGQILMERTLREKPDAVRDLGVDRAMRVQLADDRMTSRLLSFADDLVDAGEGKLGKAASREEALGRISEYASRQGRDDAVREAWRGHVWEKAAKEHLEKDLHNYLPGRQGTFLNKVANFFSDNQFVFRDMDNRLGLGIEPDVQALSNATGRMGYPRNGFRSSLDKIFRATDRATDKSIVDGDRVYRALDTGIDDGLTEGEKRAVDQFREYFRKGRAFVNGLVREKDPGVTPLSIPEITNYVPHYTLPTDRLQTAFSRRIAEAGRARIAALDPKGLQEAAAVEGPIRDILEGIRLIGGTVPQTGKELLARVSSTFVTKEGRARLETLATSALERKADIPLWMREKNLYKLADSWASNTLKHLYLRKHIDRLAAKARVLEKGGATTEAAYLRNLLADLQGVRKGTMAEQTSLLATKYQQALDRVLEKDRSVPVQAAVAVAKAVPEVMQDMMKHIYPNLLGASPRAIIMGSTQLIAKTIPELGDSPYGTALATRAAVHTLKNRTALRGRLASYGFQPAEFVSKWRGAVTDGIRRSSLYMLPQNLLTKAGDYSLYLYTKVDEVNRMVTLSMADMMTADLLRGGKAARAAEGVLGRFPESVRYRVGKARAAGNEEEVARIIGSHLNASTQYNYNRASMSEFGRTMGPLFSIFSKWPTATAGEIVAEYREKGAYRGSTRLAQKFVAPYLLLASVDYLLGADDKEEISDRQKLFLGSGGLRGSAPIGSAGPILKGDFFSPPAVDAAVKGLLLPALDGDGEKVRKGLSSAIQNFTPGSVWARFFLDDVPTFVTGRRVAGDTFVDRTSRSLDKLTD